MAFIQGVLGEWGIRAWLIGLDTNEYTKYNDLYIPKKDGTTAQIDHLIVSKYGLFVIETKNYKGWIFGDETSNEWTQVLYEKKFKFFNPILQNKGHVKALAEYLEINHERAFIPVVVFMCRATFKKLNVTTPVIYSINMRGFINNHREVLLDEKEVLSIKVKLSVLGKANYATKEAHVQTIKDKKEEMKSKCPKCGGTLVKRKGEFGEFLGCSNYPKCHFTRQN